MKILITGAGGMVGSHMIDHYHAEGEVSITGTFFRPTTDITDIAGKATLKEAKELLDEGIEVSPLPFPIAEPEELN